MARTEAWRPGADRAGRGPALEAPGRPERRLARPLAIASLVGLLAAGGLTVTACTPQTTGANSGQVTSPATVAPTTPTPTATVTATPTLTAPPTVTATPNVAATAIVTATAAP